MDDGSERADFHQFGLETINDGLFVGKGSRSECVPVASRDTVSTREHDLAACHVEEGVGDGCIERVLGEMSGLAGVYIVFRLFRNAKACMCVDFLRRPLSVWEALESLADTHVCEPVDIALWRYVEVVSFECVGRVRHDVQVPREAETLAVHGHESEVNAGLSFDEEGVHDVVVVEGDGKRRGEWAHEAIEHDVDVVGEYVDGLEDSLYVLTNASVVQQLVKSVPSLCLHHFALFGGVELGIFVGELLADTDGEDRRLYGFCLLLIASEYGAVDTYDGGVLADTEGVYLYLSAINTEDSVFEVHGIDEVF